MISTLTLIYILFIIGLTFSKNITIHRGVPLTNKEKKQVKDTVESDKESQDSKEEQSSSSPEEQPKQEISEVQPETPTEQPEEEQKDSSSELETQPDTKEPQEKLPDESSPEKTEKQTQPQSPKEDQKSEKPPKQGKKEKHITKKEKKDDVADEKDDFLYIVRLANTDIDGKKQVMHGLTQIKGIGRRLAIILTDKAGVDRTLKMGNLSEKQLTSITEALGSLVDNTPGWMLNHRKDYDSGEDIHLISGDIELKLRDDINKLKMIRSYRGVRHELGLPSRGQRTRANSRRGLAMGVSKKSQQK